MINLTDRQRFALRESLCDVLSGYSEGWSASRWDAEAVAAMEIAVSRPDLPAHGAAAMYRQLRGLVELLGEWPVGYRGEGGWEKIEL